MTRLLLAALLLAACGSPATPAPHPSGSLLPSAPPVASPALDACHTPTVVLCVLNPDVRQDTIGTTICRSGWTATIRPPSSYTDALKVAQMQRWDLAGPPSLYEEDHRMPLELGGAPKDEQNLTPEQPASPNDKDRNEDALYQLVCTHKVGLVAAQVELVARWLGPYPTYLR